MHVTETLAEGLKRGFKVVVPAIDMGSRISSRFEQVRGEAQLPGFRPGKVPLKVVKQRFGQSVLSEVLQGAVEESTSKLLSERNLKPALTPKVEIKAFAEGKDLEYDVSLEILPEIGAVDFSTIEIERLTAEPAEDEIEKSLLRLAEDNRRWQPVTSDRATVKGDLLEVDYIGTAGGKKFDGSEGTDAKVEIGAAGVLAGFADPLIGHKVGDTVDTTVTLPENFGDKTAAGKEAKFKVTIKKVHEQQAIAVDDAFAKTLGFDGLTPLRDALKDQMRKDLDRMTRTHMKRVLFDQLAERHVFPTPPGLVEQEFAHIWRQVEQAKSQGGLDAEDAKKSDDELKADYRKIAERRVRLGLLLSEVGKQNQVSVTAEELNRAVMDEARRYPGEERKVIEFYRNNAQARISLQAPIVEEKVVDHILGKAKLKERSVPAKELVALAQAGDADGAAAPEHEHAHDHDHDHAHDHDHDHAHDHDHGHGHKHHDH
jgi:trigger factor